MVVVEENQRRVVVGIVMVVIPEGQMVLTPGALILNKLTKLSESGEVITIIKL